MVYQVGCWRLPAPRGGASALLGFHGDIHRCGNLLCLDRLYKRVIVTSSYTEQVHLSYCSTYATIPLISILESI